MKIHIIYTNYLLPDGSGMSIGGIQTYITELKDIIIELGYEVYIHQIANEDFVKKYDGFTIIGYNVGSSRRFLVKLLDKSLQHINQNEDLVIFGCESHAVKKLKCKTIGIQHGISWDKPGRKDGSSFYDFKSYIKKAIKGYLTVRRISNVNTLVCVDYNFVNWYRALVEYPHIKLSVNPNFCKIPSERYKKPDDKINIIFARRFFSYRGTHIFTEAIKKICKKYPQVSVTVAGSGPDEKYLRENLTGNAYSFIKYNSNVSLEIHKDKHIAVIPTLGSEGTSLSLLESMAASCVPVCTDVGGMTNVIIDHFNGVMISPTSDNLFEALDELILNESLRTELAYEAYHTVKQSFNFLKWKDKWKDILIRNISSEENKNNNNCL